MNNGQSSYSVVFCSLLAREDLETESVDPASARFLRLLNSGFWDRDHQFSFIIVTSKDSNNANVPKTESIAAFVHFSTAGGIVEQQQ